MRNEYDCPWCDSRTPEPTEGDETVCCECGARLRIGYDADGEGYAAADFHLLEAGDPGMGPPEYGEKEASGHPLCRWNP